MAFLHGIYVTTPSEYIQLIFVRNEEIDSRPTCRCLKLEDSYSKAHAYESVISLLLGDPMHGAVYVILASWSFQPLLLLDIGTLG